MRLYKNVRWGEPSIHYVATVRQLHLWQYNNKHKSTSDAISKTHQCLDKNDVQWNIVQ